MTVRAVISIGTNSTRLLVADILPDEQPRIVAARSVGTRLGEGLGETGHVSDEAMQRTLVAVSEHAAAASAYTSDVSAISTSAVRRAQNEAKFSASVAAVCGNPLRIIAGDEEARLSFVGALATIDERGSFGVLDSGGGSTEYAIGTHESVVARTSLEVGAVRLTERVPGLSGEIAVTDAPSLARGRAIARQALAALADFARVERMVLVGGSATTAAAMRRGSREPFELYDLRRADIEAAVQRIAGLDLASRRRVAGVNPQRADILLGGLMILEEAMKLCNHEAAIVSANDLLLGYLLDGSANV